MKGTAHTQRFIVNNFEVIFSKLVRDINTRSIKWKQDCVSRIKYIMTVYLNREIYDRNIIHFNLEVNRIGQSIIEYDLKYIKRYYEKSKEVSFRERIKTPNEVCKIILSTSENAIIQKINQENNGAIVCSIM